MALVLGASEAMGLSAIWLWIAVSSFVAGRILYFVLYDQKVRAVPMIMTQFPAAAIGVWVILTIWS
ncbi:prolipoprotein diacylglyceryl transferase [Roseibium sp. TrichSKD4]|nr:prolipoprotein diacylglyceryl transferase [Roseibium sp. TrichSKD4]